MIAHQGMLQQLPLFPYLGPGDIVPTAALSLTLPDTPRVHFYHYNDIPEVILCMASEGGLIATGQLYLQQGTHGVTTFIRQPTGPEGKHYQISLIIIRMKRGGPAERGLHPALRQVQRDRVPHGSRRLAGARRTRTYPELANIRFYADAVDAYNAEPRTCGKCGVAQPRFPQELMGWRRYAQYVELANRARTDIEARGAVTRCTRTQEDAQRVQGRASTRSASYDDFPVGPPGTDPMPHLSRNRVRAAVLPGQRGRSGADPDGRRRGEIELRRRSSRARWRSSPGDTVYIPACVPSRLVPHGENVQIRLKAEPGVREAVAWYCALVRRRRARDRHRAPASCSTRYWDAVARVQRRTARMPRVRQAAPAAPTSATSPGPTSLPPSIRGRLHFPPLRV